MEFKEALNNYLQEKGLKKGKFCELLGISRPGLHDFETNKRPLGKHWKIAIESITNKEIKFEE